MNDDRNYQQMYFMCRRSSFVSRVAHTKGIELVNLILNPGSIGSIEECAKEFRRAVKSAEASLLDAANDEDLAAYFDLGPT